MCPAMMPRPVSLATTTTDMVAVDASVLTWCTTVSATPGQTVTLSLPSFASSSSSSATTQMPPSLVPWQPTTIVSTTTATEIEIYLQTATAIYSTWTIPLTSTGAQPTSQPEPPSNSGQLVYVVSPAATSHCAGAGAAMPWSCWSLAAKIGLVVGVVLAALVLMLAICRCLRGNSQWIAHDWRWARHAEGPVNANVVPTVQVNGPLDSRLATPWGYGYGNGYGNGNGNSGYGQGGWAGMR